MKCIEILIKEHQLILEMLKILERNIYRDKPDVPLIEDILRFVLSYVDEFHHYKEEDLLFQWMIRRDSELEHGPIARMQQEHQLGRSMIKRSNDFVQKLKINFNQETYIELCDTLGLFINMLRGHILKENNILYFRANEIDQVTRDGDKVMLEKFNELRLSLADELLIQQLFAAEALPSK